MKDYNRVGKYQVFLDVIEEYFEKQKDIVVLEYRRLRSLAGSDKFTDGWSTKMLAENEKVSQIYSIDTDESTIEKCQKLISENVQKKVTYAKSINEYKLALNSIDILFLDADNDPQQCINLYYEAKPYLKEEALVLIDDVFDTKGHKGEIIIPELKGKGYFIKEFHPMALLIPYKTSKTHLNISAVIFTYLRPEALEKQLEAIKSQTVPCKEIIIGHLVNDKTPSFDFKDYKLIKFHYDPGIHTKFIIACASQPKTDFIAIFDDDMIPGKKWFENCLDSYMKKEGAYGMLGFNLSSQYYSHGAGDQFPTNEIVESDFLGQGWFFPFKHLQYMWAEPYPFHNQNGDDIWFGYQLAKKGIKNYVPPYPKDDVEKWGVKESMSGSAEVALCRRDRDHASKREKLINIAKERGWIPRYLNNKQENVCEVKTNENKMQSKAMIIKKA